MSSLPTTLGKIEVYVEDALIATFTTACTQEQHSDAHVHSVVEGFYKVMQLVFDRLLSLNPNKFPPLLYQRETDYFGLTLMVIQASKDIHETNPSYQKSLFAFFCQGGDLSKVGRVRIVFTNPALVVSLMVNNSIDPGSVGVKVLSDPRKWYIDNKTI